jgi:2-haloacid dehalogenase
MTVTRRNCLTLTALAAFGRRMSHAERSAHRAIAFDAFTIFDPRVVAARATELYPNDAGRLIELWQTRQFEYTWLRTMTNTYVDFRKITEDSLVYAARSTGVELTGDNKHQLIACFYALPAWPDVKAVLAQLRESGKRLVLLSNFTEEMLTACVRANDLGNLFDHLLSTDRVRAFKPDPRAYQVPGDVLRLNRAEIAYAAFAAWDVAGSRAFGYRTFWVNRMRVKPEQLDGAADSTDETLAGLLR